MVAYDSMALVQRYYFARLGWDIDYFSDGVTKVSIVFDAWFQEDMSLAMKSPFQCWFPCPSCQVGNSPGN